MPTAIAIDVFSYRLPYHRPQTWSDVREDAADYVLLRLRDADGRCGLAEATVKPTWSGHTVGTMVAALRELVLPILRGLDLAAPAVTQTRLAQIAEQPQLRGLAETALWNLLAQRDDPRTADMPLRLPVSCTLTRQAPAAMADEAVQFAASHGVRRFKLKGGQGIATDADGVRRVRAAVSGSQVQVDANSAYAAADLITYAAQLRDAGAVLLEDPCPLQPLGFAQQAAACALPLLVDLAARDEAAAAWYAVSGAGAISVKPGRYGAPQALRVATAARAHGARVGLGLFGESDLGCALNLRVAASWPQDATVVPAELTAHLGLAEHLLPGGMRPVDGWLAVPTAADVAAQLDVARMTHHAH